MKHVSPPPPPPPPVTGEQPIRVTGDVELRLISREEWDAAAAVVFRFSHRMPMEALERLAKDAKRLGLGKKVIVTDGSLTVEVLPEEASGG